MKGLNETYPCSYHLPMDGAQIEKPEKEVKKQEGLSWTRCAVPVELFFRSGQLKAAKGPMGPWKIFGCPVAPALQPRKTPPCSPSCQLCDFPRKFPPEKNIHDK